MKRTIVGLAALAAAALAFAAGAAEAQTPKKGGNLVFAISAETPHYDCHGSETYATLHFSAPFYSTLVRFNLSKFPEIEGDLAKSWTVAPDFMSYTFKLNEGVKFHDGTPFTSADVKATYDRMRNPPQGVVSPRKATFDDIASIETPDPNTVVFKMKAVNASMLEHFASPWNCIYAAKDLAADPNAPRTKINGTGPFSFVEHVKGSHVAGKRNEAYFKQGLPYLDGFKGVFTLQAAAMLNAVQGGQVLGEFRGISPAERDRLVAAMGDKLRIEESSWTLNLLVAFNTTKKPFDDVRVRRALALALDQWKGAPALSKIANVRTVGGIAFPGSPLAATKEELQKLPGYWPDIEKARAEAKRLLKEAGAEGLRFELLNRNVDQPYKYIAAWVIDEWRKIGLNVTQRVLPTGPFYEGLRGGNFDVTVDFNCQGVVNPPLDTAKYLPSSVYTENYGQYEDPKSIELYNKMLHEPDPEKQRQLMRDFETYTLDTAAHEIVTPWWYRVIPHQSYMKGWTISPSHYINQHLETVWIDKPGTSAN